MINFRIIARFFSLLLIVEGLFMLLPAAVSYLYSEHEAVSFLLSAVVTIITGIIMFTPLRNEERVTGKKEGYIIITGIWLIFSIFGTLPYLFSRSAQSIPDAFFESVSGFTTTGATVFPDVESLSHGMLFWRSLTQWLGGMGIIFISLYVLPVFRSIYIQMPAGDFAGQTADKIHPRIKDASKRLIIIYFILTLVEISLLSAGGMPLFDSVCHSFSTLSTGGFCTRNEGIAAFSSPFVLIVVTIFMFVAGTNMTFIYFGLKGNFKKVFANNEFFFYALVCVSFAVAVSLALVNIKGDALDKASLLGVFHSVSIITTTGFYIPDPGMWPQMIIIIFFILMFTGGTTGSTSGGIKIIRLLLVTRNTGQELKRLVHPNAVIPVRIDKRIIPQTIIFNLLVYISLYFLIICVSAFVISFMGFDLITSFSTSASMLGNIGPALGSSGPFTDFSGMAVSGKLFLTILMIGGRLELLTVMVLFTRSFYRR